MRRSSIGLRATLSLVTLAMFSCALGAGRAHAEDFSESEVRLEEPRSRQGYWIGFGLSGVAAGLRENGRNLGMYSGMTGTFRIGQLITPRLGLGLLIEYLPYGGFLQKNTDKGSTGGLTLEGSCRIWRDLSMHTGFGLGWVMVKDDQAHDTSLRGGGGTYLLLGASYDIFPFKKHVTGGWALTPVVDVHLMPDGDIKFLSVLAGVQLTWWSGLPDNMLRLPEE